MCNYDFKILHNDITENPIGLSKINEKLSYCCSLNFINYIIKLGRTMGSQWDKTAVQH